MNTVEYWLKRIELVSYRLNTSALDEQTKTDIVYAASRLYDELEKAANAAGNPRRVSVGDTVRYSAMPSLSGEVTEIHGQTYVVLWRPVASRPYVSYHSADDLI